MRKKKIDKLIINSPYEEPKQYWLYDPVRKDFEIKKGRRKAGYVIASNSEDENDPGQLREIPLVNKIRKKVKSWRESGYIGATGVTKKLLKHWYNIEARDKRFFFCQLDAIETIIWLTEAPHSEKVGIEIQNDGGEFKRYCTKMATGTGKTVDMAMLIAWQILNKVAYPNDPRFSKYIFIVTPGITIKNRLQVLLPQNENNYYDEFKVVPHDLRDNLNQGKILVENWHTLQWEDEEKLAKKRTVDKRGVISNEAYARMTLKELSRGRNIIVINDESHHAWRTTPETDTKGINKEEIEEATIWIKGLDRIHKSRNILACYGFTATPFVPSGKKASEEHLFDWIISDFGLNDSIESGLVKTPRIVVRDDGQLSEDMKSKFYHIYKHEKNNLNRQAKETEGLPDLVTIAYTFLGKDWSEWKKKWKKDGAPTPPVMITVANRTETSARIKYAFEHKKIHIDELCELEKILHIDSRVLKKAEIGKNIAWDADSYKNHMTQNGQAEFLRMQVDTIGKIGHPGEQIQNVISVGMLSEGWDAKTVTHIMGLRAFTSQLLCEQVVGRGLRRTSYEINEKTGLFDPEYVNVFGVPFSFLPHESYAISKALPQSIKIAIEPVKEKERYELQWPNVMRINHMYKPELSIDTNKIKPLYINAYKTPTIAELAPTIDGQPILENISEISLHDLAIKYRKQKIIFETSRDIYEQMKPKWKGNREYLLAQVIKIVEQFVNSDKIRFYPRMFEEDDLKKRLLITLNMEQIVQYMWESIRFENTECIEPLFNTDKPILSTGDMAVWYTKKKCAKARKSHINLCVYDSRWEASESFELDRNPLVKAWAKNDHLGFEIKYIYRGEIHRYIPDFIVQLIDNSYLIIEVKGKKKQKDITKQQFLDEWIKAVNQYGGFGTWKHAVSRNPLDLKRILKQNCQIQ